MMNTKKNHVILTAKELFATKGYSNCSVQNIIDKSEISKGTFYNYFDSKDEFLIAYLNAAKEEENRRRDALLCFENKADKSIFIKQILVRIEIMREFTLRPIHEITLFSDHTALKAFIKNDFIKELKWLAERLIHIYGEESTAYASDSAVLMHGMIQHMIFTWSALTEQKLNLTLLIQYIVRRMDSMMEELVKSEDLFLEDIQLTTFSERADNLTKENVIKNLITLKQSIRGSHLALHQHTNFLIEELQVKDPRVHLLYSVIQAFKKCSSNSMYKREIELIASELKEYFSESIS